jgi:hypothetical protein
VREPALHHFEYRLMVSLNTEMHNDDSEFGRFDPTPEQIRARASGIRQKWSVRTRHRRRVQPHSNWLVPLIKVADVSAAADNN